MVDEKQYNDWIKLYGIDIANQLRDKYINRQVKIDNKAKQPSDYKLRKFKKSQKLKFNKTCIKLSNRIKMIIISLNIVPKRMTKNKIGNKIISSAAYELINRQGIIELNSYNLSHDFIMSIIVTLNKAWESNQKEFSHRIVKKQIIG